MSDRDLYVGLIRLHILYHADCEEIFGLAVIEALAHHGYKLSPGTLYLFFMGSSAEVNCVSSPTSRRLTHQTCPKPTR
jgi:hypothetical protein